MENSAHWTKILFATHSGTGFIFDFLRRTFYESFLDFENIFFTSSRIMRRAWHWFEAGYNETKQLYHSTNCISLYFLIHRKYTIWNLEAGFWLVFCPWCFVEGMKLNLGRVSEAWSIFWILNLVGTADFEVDAWSRLWRWSRFVFELVIWPFT